MKKRIYIVSALILFANVSQAQSGWNTGVDLTTNISTNNVGIGTATPSDKLSVNGDIGFEMDPSLRKILGRSSVTGLQILANTGTNDGGSILLHGLDGTSEEGSISLISTYTGMPGPAFNVKKWSGMLLTNLFHVGKDGMVGIGTDNPRDNLTVSGFSIGFENSTGTYRNIYGRSPNSGLVLYGNNGFADGGGMILNGHNNASGGQVAFVAGDGSGGNVGFDFMQYNGGAYTSYLNIHKDGNIYTHYDVHIGGALKFHNTSTGHRIISGVSDTYGMAIYANNDWSDGSGIMLNSKDNNGSISFVCGEALNPQDDHEEAISFWNTWNHRIMTMYKKNGKVVIGEVPVVTSGQYKLYVEDGIITEKIKVANASDAVNWADFVFDNNYELPMISEVEEFIKKNRHLPEIPSAEEVAKNGIDVVEIESKLLQKIEELTLYIIQQQKEIEKLKESSHN